MYILADAAVWNVKIANSAKNPHITTQAISSVDPSDPMNAGNKGGVFVQFELVESTLNALPELHVPSTGLRGSVAAKSEASQNHTRMLVCSHVDLVGKSELSLMPVPNENTFHTVVQDASGRWLSCM